MVINDFIKKNKYLLVLAFLSFVFAFVDIRMNVFSYNNFDFGKFDLGNMSQMLWNTLHGKFMYLTDYFGTNLPRWAMSHVDPIILIFLPIFYFFPHPLTLVFSQVILLSLSSLIIYKISQLELKSDFLAFLMGVAYLAYPALGFVSAKTTFHGVSVAVFFFFVTFYLFEKIYLNSSTKKVPWVLAWVFLLITMAGKEQIALYLFFFGLFLLLFRSKSKLEKVNAALISSVSFVWFILAFFVVIPSYAPYRAAGYQKFAQSLNINTAAATDVDLPNYFLSRYPDFGDSYVAIIKNILLNPELVVRIAFGGDKLENFNKTFIPALYMSFGAPQVLLMAVPDLMMNYLTSSSGVGTSEISNHRISMIIPVVFISSILFIKYLLEMGIPDKFRKHRSIFLHVLVILFALSNIFFSFRYENPVFLWMQQALKKRLPVSIVEAKTAPKEFLETTRKLGDVVKITSLENKDRDCARIIVNSIPEGVSVSGPDYLGAHLSLRETYAIFPALSKEADYVIVDVFSRKILTILNLDPTLIKQSVKDISQSPEYQLDQSCGNLFVFKKVAKHERSTQIPIQESYRYPTKYNFPIYGGLSLVDFRVPEIFRRNQPLQLKFTYTKEEQLSDYSLFFTMINKGDGEIYQIANLPSFAIFEPENWVEGYYYTENLEMVVPSYLNGGSYETYVGMTNNIKNRSVYLGDVELR